jgi:hypothetical protein
VILAVTITIFKHGLGSVRHVPAGPELNTNIPDVLAYPVIDLLRLHAAIRDSGRNLVGHGLNLRRDGQGGRDHFGVGAPEIIVACEARDEEPRVTIHRRHPAHVFGLRFGRRIVPAITDGISLFFLLHTHFVGLEAEWHALWRRNASIPVIVRCRAIQNFICREKSRKSGGFNMSFDGIGNNVASFDLWKDDHFLLGGGDRVTARGGLRIDSAGFDRKLGPIRLQGIGLRHLRLVLRQFVIGDRQLTSVVRRRFAPRQYFAVKNLGVGSIREHDEVFRRFGEGDCGLHGERRLKWKEYRYGRQDRAAQKSISKGFHGASPRDVWS